MEDFLSTFGSLGGVGALIAAIVNVLKTTGLVKDGQAPTWVVGFNLLGMILLFALGIFQPNADIAGMDETAGQLAVVLFTVFGFVWQLISSKVAHSALKGAPVLGKSYANEMSKAEMIKATATAYEHDLLSRQEG